MCCKIICCLHFLKMALIDYVVRKPWNGRGMRDNFDASLNNLFFHEQTKICNPECILIWIYVFDYTTLTDDDITFRHTKFKPTNFLTRTHRADHQLFGCQPLNRLELWTETKAFTPANEMTTSDVDGNDHNNLLTILRIDGTIFCWIVRLRQRLCTTCLTNEPKLRKSSMIQIETRADLILRGHLIECCTRMDFILIFKSIGLPKATVVCFIVLITSFCKILMIDF